MAEGKYVLQSPQSGVEHVHKDKLTGPEGRFVLLVISARLILLGNNIWGDRVRGTGVQVRSGTRAGVRNMTGHMFRGHGARVAKGTRPAGVGVSTEGCNIVGDLGKHGCYRGLHKAVHVGRDLLVGRRWANLQKPEDR